MKTVRLHSAREFRLHEETKPTPAAGEALLRIRSVGVCASDVHYYEEGAIGDAVVEKPLVLGHEVGAEVAEVGEGVTTLQVGDRVAVEPGNNCGVCDCCQRGLVNLCPQVRFFGTPPVDGAFREYVAWPERLCIKIPDNLNLDEAAMTEPMAVGIYAAEMADLLGDETIAIIGAGAIGLSVLQAVKVAGVGKALIADPIANRTELAQKLGADATLTMTGAEAIQDIREKSGRKGPEIVFECAGSNDAVQQAIEMVDFDGTVIIVGIPYPDEVKFTASVARRKNLTIKFVRRSRNGVEDSLQWASEGKINLKSYVTHSFSIDQADEALKLARDKRDGVIRAVVRF